MDALLRKRWGRSPSRACNQLRHLFFFDPPVRPSFSSIASTTKSCTAISCVTQCSGGEGTFGMRVVPNLLILPHSRTLFLEPFQDDATASAVAIQAWTSAGPQPVRRVHGDHTWRRRRSAANSAVSSWHATGVGGLENSITPDRKS